MDELGLECGAGRPSFAILLRRGYGGYKASAAAKASTFAKATVDMKAMADKSEGKSAEKGWESWQFSVFSFQPRGPEIVVAVNAGGNAGYVGHEKFAMWLKASRLGFFGLSKLKTNRAMSGKVWTSSANK